MVLFSVSCPDASVFEDFEVPEAGFEASLVGALMWLSAFADAAVSPVGFVALSVLFFPDCPFRRRSCRVVPPASIRG
ncbi:hypothetical protein [Bifidobacterium sp. ESL0745]|uniref:hypothetical protein n=1 Tax=Bifidobacterium sp. ESL0745 TaxID=2983226 RepID=UPI0023F68FF6|nr:hypothetical protein [Bifidobacterium sp. ESL0745]MDF7666018.1 hypothetical protein [Bifidobacterium sp. ESL0745]